MTLDTLTVAGWIVSRRHRRDYQGKRRQPRNAPANHLLTPAAYQLVTGTREPVPATADDATGLLMLRDIHPTGTFTVIPAVNGVNTGEAL